MVKRSIDSLVAKYQRTGIYGDVYVEGLFDKRVVDWYASKMSLRDCVAYSISSVDVPPSLVESYGLNPGSERSRVITLANELSRRVGGVQDRVLCIADCDDCAYNNIDLPSCALFTEYSSMDMYFVTNDFFHKFLYLVVGDGSDRDDCIEEVLRISKNLYRYRRVLNSRGSRMPKISKAVNILSTSRIEVDLDYMYKYMITNGIHKRDAEELITNNDDDLVDPKRSSSSRDLLDILHELCKKFKCSYSSSNVVRDAMLMSASLSHISSHDLFGRIVDVSRPRVESD